MEDKHIPLDYTIDYWKENNPAAYELALEVARLKGALDRYGWHDASCKRNPCTCGLTKALESEDKKC